MRAEAHLFPRVKDEILKIVYKRNGSGLLGCVKALRTAILLVAYLWLADYGQCADYKKGWTKLDPKLLPCGPTAAYLGARHLGVSVEKEAVLQLIPVAEDGLSNMLDIYRAFQRWGIKVEGKQCNVGD